MRLVKLLEEFIDGASFAGLHFLQPPADALDGLQLFDQLQKFLIGGRVLHDERRLTVHGEQERRSGLLELLDELRGLSLEVSEGMSVAAKFCHGLLNRHHVSILLRSLGAYSSVRSQRRSRSYRM